MGSGAPTRTRYIGGKLLFKYYQEDVIFSIQNYLDIFNMNETKAFEIFKAFACSDVREQGLVTVKEFFLYINCKPTKFTERIFYSDTFKDEDGQYQSGLIFKAFFILMWNYCTLSYEGIAHYIYEIFDIDNENNLERPHVMTMWRMLYDYEDVDEEHLSFYHFDKIPIITKQQFGTISSKHRYVIQPAIDFQLKLKKKMGGSTWWNSLCRYRYRTYKDIIKNSINMNDFIETIIKEAIERGRLKRIPNADYKIKESQEKLLLDTEIASNEYNVLQQQAIAESKRLESTAPDLDMKEAWDMFEQQKIHFSKEEYTLDDYEQRYIDRMQLFTLYDLAIEESNIYWEYKDNKDREIIEGTDADHNLRYQDLLKLNETKIMLEVVSFIKTLEISLENVVKPAIEKYEKSIKSLKNANKKIPLRKKSEKEGLMEAQLLDLKQTLKHLFEEGLNEKEVNKRYKLFYDKDFSEERKLIKQNCSRKEIDDGYQIAYKQQCLETKEKFIKNEFQKLDQVIEKRRRQYIMKEFDIITNYGSRITQWEYVLNKDENVYLYINRTTKEKRHPKTAICEQCDSIYIQHEQRCAGCNILRSAKNQRLFRPLGFKDITLE